MSSNGPSPDLVRRLLAWAALSGAGVVLGFGTALLVGIVLKSVLPPFGPGDDDTAREFVPVALMYGTWAIVTVAISTLAWRYLSRRQGQPGA
jgi:multisubunit Na+/H+ antiporter MnhE subunit